MPDHSIIYACEQCYFHQRYWAVHFFPYEGGNGEWQCECWRTAGDPGFKKSDGELDAGQFPWWQPTGYPWMVAWHTGLPEGGAWQNN